MYEAVGSLYGKLCQDLENGGGSIWYWWCKGNTEGAWLELAREALLRYINRVLCYKGHLLSHEAGLIWIIFRQAEGVGDESEVDRAPTELASCSDVYLNLND